MRLVTSPLWDRLEFYISKLRRKRDFTLLKDFSQLTVWKHDRSSRPWGRLGIRSTLHVPTVDRNWVPRTFTNVRGNPTVRMTTISCTLHVVPTAMVLFWMYDPFKLLLTRQVLFCQELRRHSNQTYIYYFHYSL